MANIKRHYAMFFCLAITIHNVEEALWLPEWSQSGSSFQQPVTAKEFHFAVFIIMLLAYVLSFLYVRFPKINLLKWAFIGFLGSMVFNAIFRIPLLATIMMKTYVPGVVTGILLNIPINTIILYKLHKINVVTKKEIVISTVVVGILLLAMIRVLFAVGGT